MPLPEPTPDEDHDHWISRCMAHNVMRDEFPDQGQRAAVCQQQWENKDMTEANRSFDAAIDGWLKSHVTDYAVRPMVKKGVEVDEASRTVTGVITSEVVDRDQEVVLVKGMDLTAYRKNPVVLFMHDPKSIVGKALWVKRRVQNGVAQLVAKVQFAATELADEVFGLIRGGFLRGFSVGMPPSTMELRDPNKAEARKFPGVRAVIASSELAEFSIVSVPANQDALTGAVDKGMILRTKGLLSDVVAEAIASDETNVTPVRTIERVTVVERVGKRFAVEEIRQRVARRRAYYAGRV